MYYLIFRKYSVNLLIRLFLLKYLIKCLYINLYAYNLIYVRLSTISLTYINNITTFTIEMFHNFFSFRKCVSLKMNLLKIQREKIKSNWWLNYGKGNAFLEQKLFSFLGLFHLKVVCGDHWVLSHNIDEIHTSVGVNIPFQFVLKFIFELIEILSKWVRDVCCNK